MNLHEFIILMTLLIGISGYNEIQMILSIGTLRYNIRYTSEYILKLQIHQHLLLALHKQQKKRDPSKRWRILGGRDLLGK